MRAGSLPDILIINEYEDIGNEATFADILMEYGRDHYSWTRFSVMDAYMRTIPPGLDLAVLDIGMLSPLHRELIDKLIDEGRIPILIHLTDDRPEIVRFLESMEGVWHMKKPASIHEINAVIKSILERNSG